MCFGEKTGLYSWMASNKVCLIERTTYLKFTAPLTGRRNDKDGRKVKISLNKLIIFIIQHFFPERKEILGLFINTIENEKKNMLKNGN